MKQQTPHDPTSETLDGNESLPEIQNTSLEAERFEKRSITEILRERLLTKIGLVEGDGIPNGVEIIEGPAKSISSPGTHTSRYRRQNLSLAKI